MAMAVVDAVERPVADALAERNTSRAGWPRQLAAFLALDAMMWGWHVATHRVPALWRLHRVHHVDTALDMTTALRFHMLDMLVSVPFRAVQISITGATPATWRLWQSWFFANVLFHHANIALPARAERALSWFIATPGMHDTHHRAAPAATDSNYSSGLAVWDRLFGTFREDPRDGAHRIGVAGYGEADCGIEASIKLPFMPSKQI